MASTVLHSKLLVWFVSVYFISCSHARDIFMGKKLQSGVNFPAYYVFGDSTVDSGNNNFIPTIAKANFPPYGKDLPNHIPTGRFSNGKLATDLLFSQLGLGKMLPPYMDSKLTIHDMINGTSFGSAYSGFDNLTSQISGAMSLAKQLECFRQYKVRLARALGKVRASFIIRDALYEISSGSNDLIVNYFVFPIRRADFTLDAYQDFLANSTMSFVEELMKEGARSIVIVGLGKLGSVPISRALFPATPYQHLINTVSLGFNNKLREKVDMRNHRRGARLIYFDAYRLMYKVLSSPSSYGFEESMKGCCGSGMTEMGNQCNMTVGSCADPSKYVFWDAIHPTQHYYTIISNVLYRQLALN